MNALAVRVPEDLERRLRTVARLRGRDLADEMRDALASHVEAAVEELAPDESAPAGTGRAIEDPTMERSARGG